MNKPGFNVVSEKHGVQFDPAVYRISSQDLRCLNYSDEQLTEHFQAVGYKEPRRYGYTTTKAEYFSNCYFRGLGIEIGAGANPVPMMGNATCEYGDIAEDALFDSDSFKTNKTLINLNEKIKRDSILRDKYDFVLAQHVLEHCDGFIQAMRTLTELCKKNGFIYISLPIKEFDVDAEWMDEYGFAHHFIEYFIPNAFKNFHRKKYLDTVQRIFNKQGQAAFQGSVVVPNSLYTEMLKGHLPKEYDYIYHRHSYSMQGWLKLFLNIKKVFRLNVDLIDCGYGMDRNDAHFIFKKR